MWFLSLSLIVFWFLIMLEWKSRYIAVPAYEPLGISEAVCKWQVTHELALKACLVRMGNQLAGVVDWIRRSHRGIFSLIHSSTEALKRCFICMMLRKISSGVFTRSFVKLKEYIPWLFKPVAIKTLTYRFNNIYFKAIHFMKKVSHKNIWLCKINTALKNQL